MSSENVETAQKPSNSKDLLEDPNPVNDEHDYAMETTTANPAKRKVAGAAPATPTKPSAGKKSKGDQERRRYPT